MSQSMLLHAGLLLLSTFIASVSQVMLKKSANKEHDSLLAEYLNPLVVFAYVIFFGTTLLSMLAYRKIPLSMGPILEATSYIYVTIFGVTLFHEHLNKRKVLALVVVIAGIVVYSLGVEG